MWLLRGEITIALKVRRWLGSKKSHHGSNDDDKDGCSLCAHRAPEDRELEEHQPRCCHLSPDHGLDQLRSPSLCCSCGRAPGFISWPLTEGVTGRAHPAGLIPRLLCRGQENGSFLARLFFPKPYAESQCWLWRLLQQRSMKASIAFHWTWGWPVLLAFYLKEYGKQGLLMSFAFPASITA